MLSMAISYARKDTFDTVRQDCLNVAATLIWQSDTDEEFEELCKWWKEGITDIPRDYMQEELLYFDLQNKVKEFSKGTFNRIYPTIIAPKDI